MVLISEPSLPEIFSYLKNSVIEGIYSLHLGSMWKYFGILAEGLCVERITFVLVLPCWGSWQSGEEARSVSSVSTSVQLNSLEQALHEQMGHGRTGLGRGELWCLPWSWWRGSAFSPPWCSIASKCFSELTEFSCFPSSVLCGIVDCHLGLYFSPAAATAPAVLHPSSGFPGRGQPVSRGASIPQAEVMSAFLMGWDGCWVMHLCLSLGLVSIAA